MQREHESYLDTFGARSTQITFQTLNLWIKCLWNVEMAEDWKHSYVLWFFNDSKGSVLEIAKKCLIRASAKILPWTISHVQD
jgi:hypothetical protein